MACRTASRNLPGSLMACRPIWVTTPRMMLRMGRENSGTGKQYGDSLPLASSLLARYALCVSVSFLFSRKINGGAEKCFINLFNLV